MPEYVYAIYERAWVSGCHGRYDIIVGVRNHPFIATECTGNTRNWERSAVQNLPHELKTEQI
jgi:hypothetical protein